jgi:hypothetical protein
MAGVVVAPVLVQGGFKGGRAGAHAWSSSIHPLEGPADGGS